MQLSVLIDRCGRLRSAVAIREGEIKGADAVRAKGARECRATVHMFYCVIPHTVILLRNSPRPVDSPYDHSLCKLTMRPECQEFNSKKNAQPLKLWVYGLDKNKKSNRPKSRISPSLSKVPNVPDIGSCPSSSPITLSSNTRDYEHDSFIFSINYHIY